MNIVITNNTLKEDFLKKISKNKIINDNKFMSFSELKKKLFFDYHDDTLEYIMNKYKVNINIAKIYVDNLYFLKEIDDTKIQFLINLKNELVENKLLVLNENFQKYIKKQNIIVYTNEELTKEQRLILDGLNYKEEKLEVNKYVPKVYEAKNIEEEVEFVVTKISELINKGININNIKIISNQSYNSILEYYFDLYNIPLNLKSTNTFYSTYKAQQFLKNYDNVENITDEALINIINKSVYVKNKNIRKEFIIRDMKNTMLKSSIYKNAVNITKLDNIYSSDDYVFLLGFNIKECPKIYKDDDYLSDSEKELLGLDTSIDKNKYTKINSLKNILSIPNLVITYKLFFEGPCYPSPLLDELNVDVEKINIEKKVSYSKKNSKILYAKELDELYKFNTIGPNLKVYKNNLEIPYKNYDNKFKLIDKDLILEKLEDGFNLSYTTLESFNECGFKYYLNKILDLNVYEKNFKAIIGDITHHILEIGINKEINIKEEIDKYIKEIDYEFQNKELFYLEKLSKELAYVLNYLHEQKIDSSLNNYLFETQINVTKEIDNIPVNFKGIIDKIMYTHALDKEIIAVVDYKTGEKNINLDTLKYGINIQLPIYLYLLKKSERFKDSLIAGFYIEKVLSNVFNIDHKKNLDELKQESLRLQGFSNSSETVLSYLDKNYLNSKMIKGLRFKKDGTLYSGAKVLSNAEMDSLILEVDKIIDKTIKEIIEGNYFINPKIINNKDYSCTYCKFKDICFKRKENEIKLGGEEDEMDTGTITSD